MTAEMTNINLPGEFSQIPGTIQKFTIPRSGPTKLIIWVSTMSPILEGLAGSLLPYMDAAICWYHDHAAFSCLKLQNSVALIQKYLDNIWLMATTKPKLTIAHSSNIKKMYNKHGFERPHLSGDLLANLETILLTDRFTLSKEKNS